MAVSTFSQAAISDSDANFRLWGKGLSDALTAVGIPKGGQGGTGSPDTGMIDWATVAKPALGATSQGYEIRQFNDALQASKPVLIKIEFGSGAAAATPAVWITIGTTSNGAGTLTGLLSTRKQLLASGSSATLRSCRVCGDTNRLLFAMFVDSATYSFWHCVERTHDAGGADTNEGLLIFHGPGVSTVTQVYYSMTGGEGTIEASLGVLTPVSGGTGSTGVAVALYPVFCHKGIFLNPSMNLLQAVATAVTANTSISFAFYGTTRTFFVLLLAAIQPANRSGTGNASALLIRNE